VRRQAPRRSLIHDCGSRQKAEPGRAGAYPTHDQPVARPDVVAPVIAAWLRVPLPACLGQLAAESYALVDQSAFGGVNLEVDTWQTLFSLVQVQAIALRSSNA
jgi:hypothetical protein